MAETTIGTIEELLESAKSETTDSQTALKLRIALELLEAVEGRHIAGREGVEDAMIDEEVREHLRELGYDA
jgi:hypothetical protein